jgi:hypothetical protein
MYRPDPRNLCDEFHFEGGRYMLEHRPSVQVVLHNDGADPVASEQAQPPALWQWIGGGWVPVSDYTAERSILAHHAGLHALPEPVPVPVPEPAPTVIVIVTPPAPVPVPVPVEAHPGEDPGSVKEEPEPELTGRAYELRAALVAMVETGSARCLGPLHYEFFGTRTQLAFAVWPHETSHEEVLRGALRRGGFTIRYSRRSQLGA